MPILKEQFTIKFADNQFSPGMRLASDGARRFLAQSGLHWLGYDGNSHCSNSDGSQSQAFNPTPEQDRCVWRANELRHACSVR